MNVTERAKQILVYGDSLTWARDPSTPGVVRFGAQVRWTGLLQAGLGRDYEVIEEGLRGRTLKGRNPHYPHLDGLEQFGPIFASHLPLDLVVLFLGTNDVYARTGRTAAEIAAGADDYAKVITRWSVKYEMAQPLVLLVAPPVISDAHTVHRTRMYAGGEGKTQALRKLLRLAAWRNGWHFFDSAAVVRASPADGVHLDAQGNKRLAEAMIPVVRAACPAVRRWMEPPHHGSY